MAFITVPTQSKNKDIGNPKNGNDEVFMGECIHEVGELYDRMIVFLRWTVLIGTLFAFAIATARPEDKPFGEFGITVYFIILALIGLITFFLPEKSFIVKAIIYYVENIIDGGDK